MNEKEAMEQAEEIIRKLERKTAHLLHKELRDNVRGMTPAQRMDALRRTGIAIMKMAADDQHCTIHVVQDSETGIIHDAKIEWNHD